MFIEMEAALAAGFSCLLHDDEGGINTCVDN